MNRLLILCFASLVSLAHLPFAQADNWPQWRGPLRTDISAEKCGVGYSGPAVVGDHLFIMGGRDNKEVLLCLSTKDGHEQWATPLGDQLENGWGDGPRGTPAVDGEFVYTLSGKGDVICAKVKDGSVVWSKNLTDFGGEIPNWGYTESVLIDGDQVICTPGGEKGTMLALNKRTGETVWQSSSWTDNAHYSSAIAADINGLHQYVQVTENSVAGVNAKNGEVIWKTDWPGKVAVIPTPIYHDGHVYVTSGYNVGCNLFAIDADNKVTAVYDDDARKLMKNHHGGVVLIDGHIYGHSDSVGWVCQELMSGKQVWREKEALKKGCLTSAGGMLYCMTEEEGKVALVKATPDGFKITSSFVLSPQTKIRKPQGRIWTHPVIANGKLYLRDQDLLFCFDIEQK